MTAAGWAPEELRWERETYVAHDQGTWGPSGWAGLEERSLGLATASGGALDARHLRRAGSGSVSGAFDGSAELHLLYVLRGSITVRDATRTDTLGPGAAAYHPARATFAVTAATDDFEGLALQGRGAAAGDAAGAEPCFSLDDSPAAHVLGAGPRPDVRYRDLGVAAHSGGRYRAWVVSADRPSRDMEIWHHHDMAQFFVVLDGWAQVEVRGSVYVVRPGDAVAIGAGAANQHNVRHIGEGFRILELCLPAEYGTWPGEAPALSRSGQGS
jgi:mannose-6-phosphate isomerase-like protein (cupin superfamily)